MIPRHAVVKILAVLVCTAFVFGCATTTQVKRTRFEPRQFSKSSMPKFDVPVVLNDRVMAWIDYFQGPGRSHFARYLARSGRYVPQMQEILRKYNLPQDLVYLAMIESGFSAKAYSRARAAGHWQFIGGTGKRYGLAINNWMDERRDPHDSTAAAARYLKDLYNEFGDWYLAMAAYNAGEGKIRKAIARNGTRDFFVMIERDRRFLRAETKDYVPKFIAAAIISKSPERFGFEDVVYEKPHDLDTAKVNTQTDLQVIAKCAGVPVETIEEINPELVRGATPPGDSNYEVKLPRGTVKDFELAYAATPESERMLAIRHTVKKGESAGRIARKYGVTVRQLLAANDLSSAKALKRGMVVTIPLGGAAKQMVNDVVAEEETGHPRGKAIKHRVQRGETLGLIAQAYGVDVRSLKRWNKLRKNAIHPGQVLRVYSSETDVYAAQRPEKKKAGSKSLAYTVRRGDTWSRVAQRYGVSIAELKKWNPQFAKRGLIAGQKMVVHEELVVAAKVPVIPSPDVVSSQAPSQTNMSLAEPARAAQQVQPIQPDAPTATPASDRLTAPSSEGAAPGTSSSKTSNSSDMLSIREPLPAAKANVKGISYKVKSGDTLWDIAKKYRVSVDDIKAWNALTDASHKSLKPGDVITLKVEE
jgi:membrane-bound lytic murein transglycosylase D